MIFSATLSCGGDQEVPDLIVSTSVLETPSVPRSPTILELPGAGQSLTRSVAGPVILTFSPIHLQAGEVLRLRVDQRGVDVILRILDDTFTAVEFDSQNADDGPEWLVLEAAGAGTYTIEIEAAELGHQERLASIHLVTETRGSPGRGDLELLDAMRTLGITDSPVQVPRTMDSELSELRRLNRRTERLPGLVRARVAFALGRSLRFRDRPAEAEPHLQTAQRGFREYGNAWELTPTLNHLAYVLTELGHYEEAETSLAEALELGEQLRYPRLQIATLNLWGLLHAGRGRYGRGLGVLRRAREMLHGMGAGGKKGLAYCQQNTGNLLIQMGELEAGIAALHEALEIWQELESPNDLGRTLLSLSWGLERQWDLWEDPGRLATALDFSGQAVELFRRSRSNWNLATALEFRGIQLFKAGRAEEALVLLRQSAEPTELVVDSSVDRMHRHWVQLALGPVLAQLGLNVEAREQLEAAFDGFEALQHQQGRLDVRLQLARLERRLGRRGEAAQWLSRAVDVLEKPRGDMRTLGFRRSYLSIHQEVFEELVDLWANASLAAAQRTPPDLDEARRSAAKAINAAERGRARGLLDHLAEVDRRFRDEEPGEELRQLLNALEAEAVLPAPQTLGAGEAKERGAARGRPDAGSLARARMDWQEAKETATVEDPAWRQAKPLGVGTIQPLLDDGTEVLFYALGRHRSWLFRLSEDELEVYPLASRRTIETLARRAHYLIPRWNSPSSRKVSRSTVNELALRVIAPVIDDLSKGRLVIAAAGALHWVPFGLLPDSENRPLVADREIVYLPSLSVLGELRRRAGSRQPAPRLLAVVADPVFGLEDPRLKTETNESRGRPTLGYLPRLVSSAAEATSIAQLVDRASDGPATAVWTGFRATIDLVHNGALRNTRILHFATHGLVPGRDSALAGLVFSLFDPRGRPQRGFLPARELYGLRLDADLVVLSACRTGGGREVRGEGLLGLSQGFFAAGARHLVVSLWEVDDKATSELMQRFYHHLFVAGAEPDRALRLAQNELRQSEEWSSPKFWAGFVALGDWRVKLKD